MLSFYFILWRVVYCFSSKPPKLHMHMYMYLAFISSPEMKAQVSFSDHTCPSVRPTVWRLCAGLLHFRLLQNHWANFNQSWLKSSLGKDDSEWCKWRTTPLIMIDNSKRIKIYWKSFKNLLQNHQANFTKTCYKLSLVKGNLQLYKSRDWSFSKGR
jgi:hypothetical protein